VNLENARNNCNSDFHHHRASSGGALFTITRIPDVRSLTGASTSSGIEGADGRNKRGHGDRVGST